jgi:hypothetical protein
MKSERNQNKKIRRGIRARINKLRKRHRNGKKKLMIMKRREDRNRFEKKK